jgi:hypothetical protein
MIARRNDLKSRAMSAAAWSVVRTGGDQISSHPVRTAARLGLQRLQMFVSLDGLQGLGE